MRKDWSTVDVLRHARHDWLNKLQLIKGNLDLNKIDRVKQVINEIVSEAQQEAKLSNLNIPKFAALIFTTNWQANTFRLDYEVNQETGCLNVADEIITDWTSSFLDCIHITADAYYDNNLFVTIETQRDGIRFFFDFRGIIKDKDNLQQFLDRNQGDVPVVNVLEFSQQELALEIFMPFI